MAFSNWVIKVLSKMDKMLESSLVHLTNTIILVYSA